MWSEWGDSNARPREPKSRALPTALHPDINFFSINLNVRGNYQLWSNLWSKIIFRHSSVNIIIQKPSNIKGFEASKTKSTNFLHSAPKAGALPTALHPVIELFIRLGVFSQSKRATNCANPGFLVIEFCARCGQTCGHGDFLTTSTCGGSACIAGVSMDCGNSIFRLGGGATRSQMSRPTS